MIHSRSTTTMEAAFIVGARSFVHFFKKKGEKGDKKQRNEKNEKHGFKISRKKSIVSGTT